MKKWVIYILCFLLYFGLTGCSENEAVVDASSDKTDHVMDVGQASIVGIPSIKAALTYKSTGFGEPCVIVGTVTDKVVEERERGALYQVEVHQVIHGDVGEVNLLQTYGFEWNSDEPYLMILIPRLSNKNEYHRVGVYQTLFWVEDGQLQGGSKTLVEEIKADIAAKTYTRNGVVPDVNTMDGLAEYFAARIEALEKTK
ncbi:MAG: hypothetical protein IKU17_04760 [Clostridia bacterium]|nr:hypothetical protein [Clostridia bacterium]